MIHGHIVFVPQWRVERLIVLDGCSGVPAAKRYIATGATQRDVASLGALERASAWCTDRGVL